MIKPITLISLVFGCLLLFSWQVGAQELSNIGEQPVSDTISNIRPKNVMMIGLGSALLNRDVVTPETEQFIQIQYKRFITPYLNINGNLKKFDINDYRFESEGFLSGDLNIEWYVLPQNKLTPYIYLGAGILTSNDFKDQNYKTQGGLGLDYFVTESLAFTGSIEANYIYDEQKGSQLLQEANQLYFNALLGIHFYFGCKKTSSSKKIKSSQSSVINSNPIEIN